jgi:simple sugar transport system ATP-binding protein
LRKGEVHALLGENGAGKSTLMNILYGLYSADEGEIRMNGQAVTFSSAKDAIDRGIGMVHQHFMLIPVMTVAENIVLEVEPRKAGVLLDYDKAVERVQEISTRFGLAVNPRARVENISVGQQQRVEILKALYRDAEILILDEPTAVLTPQEAGELFAIIKSLQADGTSIIFISHKLNEVLEIADRITVLRRGKRIDTVPRQGATEEGLARMMVGREVLLRVDKRPSEPGDKLLELREVSVNDDRGLPAVREVSFDVHAGEIVGLAGVEGNGQSELIEAITGPPGRRQRRDRRQRAQDHAPDGAEDAERRRRPHPGRPPAPRARARVLDRREHRAPRLQPSARLEVGLALPTAADSARREPDSGVRRARRRAAYGRRRALGRQPAEGRRRAGDRA